MFIKDYTDACLQFAKDTKGTALNTLIYQVTAVGKFAKAKTNKLWIETVDNEHGGVDVSWAYCQTEAEIKSLAPQMFVNECKRIILTAVDDDATSDEIADIVEHLMGIGEEELAMTSLPNFGIYPVDLEKCSDVIEQVLEKYPLTDAEFDAATENAKKLINAMLSSTLVSEKEPLSQLTYIINFCRLKMVIRSICNKFHLQEDDFKFDVNGSDIWVTYKNKDI